MIMYTVYTVYTVYMIIGHSWTEMTDDNAHFSPRDETFHRKNFDKFMMNHIDMGRCNGDL